MGYVCILLLVFSSCISPVFAGFRLGDSSLPVDEDDFIEYDFDDNIADPLRLKVEFVKMFQNHSIISTLVANITVSELNSSTNSYKVLTVDNMKYQNQTCLIYNKTHQFFKYEQYMNNLLEHGYGGYYIIPDRQNYKGGKKMLYDIDNLLKEAKLSEKEKNKIITELREEFPQDEMLFELHLYRVIQYLKKQKMKKFVNPTL